MTLLYADGFDTYSNYAERWTLLAGGTQVVSVQSVQSRTGGQSIRLAAPSNDSGVARAITPSATVYVHLAVYRTTSVNANNIIQLLGDGGVTQHTTLVVTTGNALAVNRGSAAGGTVIASSTGVTVPLNTWVHLCLRATLGDSPNGVIQVWYNGTQVINASSLDTKNAGTGTTYDTLGLMVGAGSNNVYYDDLVVCNSSGSVNNGFLGDVQVLPRVVNGAGDRTQLTPYGSATNYQNVDELPRDGVDYNGSATNGNADLYTMQDIGAGSTIHAVQQVTYAGKNEVGSKSIAHIVKSAGTEYPQTAQSIGTAFQPYFNVYETDPATAAAWTVAGFNAGQFGCEVRA
jgi:hypothetical protein